MKKIIKITKQEAIDAFRSKNELDLDTIIEIEEENKFLVDYSKNTALPMPSNVNGEWCPACGAWKQYGTSDTHYCTDYKVTC